MDITTYDVLPEEIGCGDLPDGHWARALAQPGERIPKGVLLIDGTPGPVTPEVLAWAAAEVAEMERRT